MKLDLAHFYTAPALAWVAALKIDKEQVLELLTDVRYATHVREWYSVGGIT